MYYIVLDLEFNQPFHFKTGFQTTLHPDCPFEIIQIGAVKLDEKFAMLDCFNFLIKPTIYPRIHPYVEKITSLTYEKLKDCPTFPQAYASFVNFIGTEDTVLCTWGSDDIKSLFKNILFYHLDTTKICNRFINVQKFASSYLKYEAGKAIGLKNAVTELHIKVEEPFHNALYDALYTAKVFQIVHQKENKPEICHISELLRKNKTTRLYVKGLVEYFEKILNRELTLEEKMLVKKAYKFGRTYTFDIPKNNKKSIP
ncbi:MAG TPA: exonuclease domain-containing protein [Candidatus Coprocola pullicola]|nr:exonuclease domain-containing protein [Candidatus Coprocola pullicola]